MKKIHYGWYVCLGCALILFCTSGLAINAFTIYQPYILRENNFTNTQSSSIIAVRSFMCFMSMFLTTAYYKKFSLRAGLSLACGFTASGFALFGFAHSFPVYCVAAAMVGLGYGLGTMIPVAMLMERWFTQKRTLALGLCSAVTGLSTLGIPTLLIRLISRIGMANTFLAEAAFIAVFAILSYMMLRSDPGKVGLLPYGGEKIPEIKQRGTNAAGIRKKDWLILWPMLLFLGAMTNTAYAHLTVHMTANGFSVDTTALAIAVSGVTLTASKCLFGIVSEKITVRYSSLLFGTAEILGLLMMCVMGTNTGLLFGGIFLYSLGISATTVGRVAWAGDWSREGQFDSTIVRFQIGYAAGGLIFSPLPGIIADFCNGSYVPAFAFFTACTVFVIAAAQFMYVKQKRNFN